MLIAAAKTPPMPWNHTIHWQEANIQTNLAAHHCVHIAGREGASQAYKAALEECGEDVDQDNNSKGEDEEAILPVIGVHLDQDQSGCEEEDDKSKRPD